MPQRLLVFLALVSLSVTASSRETWSRTEVIEWYTRFGANKPKFGYCGSDTTYHYFISRPIDSFVSPWIARSELVVADERPRLATGRRMHYYFVDPEKDFQKIAGSETTE